MLVYNYHEIHTSIDLSAFASDRESWTNLGKAVLRGKPNSLISSTTLRAEKNNPVACYSICLIKGDYVSMLYSSSELTKIAVSDTQTVVALVVMELK